MHSVSFGNVSFLGQRERVLLRFAHLDHATLVAGREDCLRRGARLAQSLAQGVAQGVSEGVSVVGGWRSRGHVQSQA